MCQALSVPGAVEHDRCELALLEPRGEMDLNGITQKYILTGDGETAC